MTHDELLEQIQKDINEKAFIMDEYYPVKMLFALPCVIRLGDLLPLLILKYGHLDNEPTDADIDRCNGCGSYMIRKCLTCQPMTTDAQTVISVKKLATDGTIDQ
jgi:hypothetical protein